MNYKLTAEAEKILEVALPPVELSSAQAEAFQKAVDYAKDKGIKVVTRIVE